MLHSNWLHFQKIHSSRRIYCNKTFKVSSVENIQRAVAVIIRRCVNKKETRKMGQERLKSDLDLRLFGISEREITNAL